MRESKINHTMSDLNDPRVFFAAERTLLAWSRTALALIAFGFVIERSGLLLAAVMPHASDTQRVASLWVGLAFTLLGSWVSVYSTLQFRRVLKTLKPVEIPDGYRTTPGVAVNLAIAVLGAALAFYFLVGA
jgi:putative membrane protein